MPLSHQIWETNVGLSLYVMYYYLYEYALYVKYMLRVPFCTF